MTVKTLIIGRREGNLADYWMKMNMGPSNPRMFFMPQPDEVNMCSPNSIHGYVRKHGPFDEIVYAAGRNRLEWIEDTHMNDLIETYQINVFGFVEVVARHLENFGNQKLRVCAIVSDSSRTPMRGSLAYSSSKSALVGVIKNMARELSPYTIVVGVSPGIIDDTPMTDYIDEAVPIFRDWEPGKAAEYEKSMIPMGRRASKREVAETMQFALTGPEYLSGSIIEITGGK